MPTNREILEQHFDKEALDKAFSRTYDKKISFRPASYSNKVLYACEKGLCVMAVVVHETRKKEEVALDAPLLGDTHPEPEEVFEAIFGSKYRLHIYNSFDEEDFGEDLSDVYRVVENMTLLNDAGYFADNKRLQKFLNEEFQQYISLYNRTREMIND
jgi:hypothetical protein